MKTLNCVFCDAFSSLILVIWLGYQPCDMFESMFY